MAQDEHRTLCFETADRSYTGQVFPLLYVPMKSFTRSVHELAAYTIVFIILTAAFGLLFMFTLGGEERSVSGVQNAFLSLLPDIVVGGGGSTHGFSTGIYRKQLWTSIISLLYAFVTTFFVSNLLFAIVWEAYIAVKVSGLYLNSVTTL